MGRGFWGGVGLVVLGLGFALWRLIFLLEDDSPSGFRPTLDWQTITAIEISGAYGIALNRPGDGRWLVSGQLAVDQNTLQPALVELWKLADARTRQQAQIMIDESLLAQSQIHRLLLTDSLNQRLALRFALGQQPNQLYVEWQETWYELQEIDGSRWLRSPLQWRDKHLLNSFPEILVRLAWSDAQGEVVGVERREESWQFVIASAQQLPSVHMLPSQKAIEDWRQALTSIEYQALEPTLPPGQRRSYQLTWSGAHDVEGCFTLWVPVHPSEGDLAWVQPCEQGGSWYGLGQIQWQTMLPPLSRLVEQGLLEPFSTAALQAITLDNGAQTIGLERQATGWQPVPGSQAPQGVPISLEQMDAWLAALQAQQGQDWLQDVDENQFPTTPPLWQIVLHFQDDITRYIHLWPAADEQGVQVRTSDSHHVFVCSQAWLINLFPPWHKAQGLQQLDPTAKPAHPSNHSLERKQQLVKEREE